ncbi:MAG TPA: hypothetical protein VMU80_15000 [Bryobacteraceae bacterium]|nr:hypothetical protein [Bryobacteraceae bacterium]HUO30530.1 hypothetical protein [Bryobacteraceae bacterium]
MKSRWIGLLGLLALSGLMALAADIDGKWMSEAEGKGGPQTLTLKSDGEKLTGSMAGGRGSVDISEGMIHGNDVMFKVVREFNGNTFTQEFKGTLSGTELKLTVSGGRRGPRDVVFKKQ